LFRKTLLKAQNDYIFYKFGGRHGPFSPPLRNFLRTPLTMMQQFSMFVLFVRVARKA